MLCALEYAADNPNDYFFIYSDSAYVVNSCNEWIRGWAANGWRNSKKQEVENIAYMKALYEYLSRPFFNAEIRKCSGHSEVVGNEIADALATESKSKLRNLLEYWEIEFPEDQD